MAGKKTWSVADLFYTEWQHLKPARHARVFALYKSLEQLSKDSEEYGTIMISILRELRRPGLKGFTFRRLAVDKITEAQAVDIFNHIEETMLGKAWYFFPELASDLITPTPELARTSFDRFIYADNEFTKYLLAVERRAPETELITLLARLAATLYERHMIDFDPEDVETDAPILAKGIPALELQQVAFTYGHVRERIVKRCKRLMSGGGESENKMSSGPMWILIKHQVARTGAFGSFNEVGRSRLYAVLDHLEQLAREQHQQKAHAAA